MQPSSYVAAASVADIPTPQTGTSGRFRSHWRNRSLEAVVLVALLVALLCADSGGVGLLPPSSPGTGTAQAAATAPERPRPPRAVVHRATGPRIVIGAVGLRAPLEPIRFEGSVLSPPEDVARAGIWADGAALADGGLAPTVITGHVSDDADHAGEFLKLWDVRPGTVARTVDDHGAVRRWRVVDVRHVPKDDLSREEFLPGDERVLRLITCASREGGSSGAFHYADNLIVDLLPV